MLYVGYYWFSSVYLILFTADRLFTFSYVTKFTYNIYEPKAEDDDVENVFFESKHQFVNDDGALSYTPRIKEYYRRNDFNNYYYPYYHPGNTENTDDRSNLRYYYYETDLTTVNYNPDKVDTTKDAKIETIDYHPVAISRKILKNKTKIKSPIKLRHSYYYYRQKYPGDRQEQATNQLVLAERNFKNLNSKTNYQPLINSNLFNGVYDSRSDFSPSHINRILLVGKMADMMDNINAKDVIRNNNRNNDNQIKPVKYRLESDDLSQLDEESGKTTKNNELLSKIFKLYDGLKKEAKYFAGKDEYNEELFPSGNHDKRSVINVQPLPLINATGEENATTSSKEVSDDNAMVNVQNKLLLPPLGTTNTTSVANDSKTGIIDNLDNLVDNAENDIIIHSEKQPDKKQFTETPPLIYYYQREYDLGKENEDIGDSSLESGPPPNQREENNINKKSSDTIIDTDKKIVLSMNNDDNVNNKLCNNDRKELLLNSTVKPNDKSFTPGFLITYIRDTQIIQPIYITKRNKTEATGDNNNNNNNSNDTWIPNYEMQSDNKVSPSNADTSIRNPYSPVVSDGMEKEIYYHRRPEVIMENLLVRLSDWRPIEIKTYSQRYDLNFLSKLDDYYSTSN